MSTPEFEMSSRPATSRLRLASIVAIGVLLVGIALSMVLGLYPVGGRLDTCESEENVQNYYGIGEVPRGEDIWLTNGSTQYWSDYVRSGAVPVIPIDVSLLEPHIGLEVKEKFAYDPRGSLFSSTLGQAGPLTQEQMRRLHPLDGLDTDHPWWAVARIEVTGIGSFESPGLRITYRAGVRRLTCDHTTGVRFEVKEQS